MPTFSSTAVSGTEPRRRFYPTEGDPMPAQTRVPSAPTPSAMPQPAGRNAPSGQKRGDAAYLAHRHPILLQRLYNAADSLLDTYPEQEFIYDAYPDYLSLHLMRDRILRENSGLTEEFLREGCPIAWLNLLTDTVISDLLCRKRCSYRNPMGDANTTSVQSLSRS